MLISALKRLLAGIEPATSSPQSDQIITKSATIAFFIIEIKAFSPNEINKKKINHRYYRVITR